MSAVGNALAHRALFRDSAVLGLLRRDLAPIVLGVLHEHLGGDVRTRAAADLYDLLEVDLAELRLQGVELPGTAQRYCTEWVRQGFLHRRPSATDGEEYSLTESALTAQRILAQLAEPRGAATRSRLTLLSDQLQRLARDTDPDTTSRIAALEQQRAQLAEEIALINEGRISPLHQERAQEAAQELFALALDVPADFARVRSSLEDLHRRLRLDLIEHDGPQGEILDQLFLGVDSIEESEAGRSFAAFHALLTDPEQEVAFNDAVDALATRPFAEQFGRERMLYLQSYLRRLQRESHQVRTAMLGLSRSLREFVRSRQFEEYRALSDRLRRVQRVGLDVAEVVRPHTRLGVELSLTTFAPRSVGQLRLHSPQDVTVDDEVLTHEAQALDLEALRRTVRESEIDMAELIDAVNDALREQSPSTIGEVLSKHPATQGLASIVGLMLLGSRHGSPADAETVHWPVAPAEPDSTGREQCARITSFRFTQEITA